MADLRKCIGSTRFEIEPQEAPIEDFPKQPSHKDGLGRMCKTHWNQYTAALAREAKARKAATEAATSSVDPDTEVSSEKGKRSAKATVPVPEAQGDAG